MANGNVESGDGYNYRGRGIFQLTGKSNYQAFSNFINTPGVDFVASPALVKTTQYSIESAMWYFKTVVLDKVNIEDATVEGVTKKVNGGSNGLDSRKAIFNTAIDKLKE